MKSDTCSEGFLTLRREVDSYLQHMEMERERFLKNIRDCHLPDKQVERLFRNLERQQNTICILQYLLAFSNSLPEEDSVQNDLINPIRQLREFVSSEVALLNQPDVSDSVLRDLMKSGLINEVTLEFYENLIKEKYIELKKMLEIPIFTTILELELLLLILKELCTFWFQLKLENPRRYRKNDVYVFSLVNRLLRKIDIKKKQNPGFS